MRTLVSIVAQHGWPVLHMDVKSAVLNGVVFLKQPMAENAKDNEKNILYTMVVAIEQIGGGESCVVWR
jgi:hypothetical protein